MKRISIILPLVILLSSVSFAQKQNNKKNKDEMVFKEAKFDYGTLEYKADGTHKFSFMNNSKEPMVISNVKSSCGCTIPSWPKEPIQPGAYGTITVKYNTKLPGSFNKTVQVFSNAKNSPVRLSVMGRILPNNPNGDKVARGLATTKVSSRPATTTTQKKSTARQSLTKNSIQSGVAGKKRVINDPEGLKSKKRIDVNKKEEVTKVKKK